MKITTSKEYAKTGTHCPVCKNTNITANPYEVDGLQVWSKITCQDCQAQWTEFYTLSGYDNLTTKEPL